jgi:hypothetical protein
MDANLSIKDAFAEDKGVVASISVTFRSFMDVDRRFHDRDQAENDEVIVKSVRFRAVEGRNRPVRVRSLAKNVADRVKTVRFLVETVAFMPKTVPLRQVMDLFLGEDVRSFSRYSGNVHQADRDCQINRQVLSPSWKEGHASLSP